MSNSSLVTYKRISPHKTSPRNHAIDTVTIHCIVGQWTAKQGCDYFATTDRDCSANYIVGKDGSIGLAVEEADRSWCSSSRDNDNRAITIEVASDTSHPYAVTDAAYNALIALLTDICKRNGIKKLLWKADKSLIGQVDKQNMTVHRWFANKACPGEYLYSRHGEIAEKVNALLNVEQEPVAPETTVPATDNPSTIWNYFKGKGLNDYAVAGIMGNIYAESGFKPTNLQNAYEKKLGYTDDSYTAAVDNGSYGNFVKDSAGYGLAQWTYWSRKQALLEYARSVGKSIGDLSMQLDFMWKEMQGYKSMMTTLNSATSVLEASNAVLLQYERPANMGESVQKTRAGYGQTYYNEFAGTSGNQYRVAVSDHTDLDSAKKQLATVQAKGFTAMVTQDGNIYVVQTGAYSACCNANEQLDRVKAAGFTDAYVTTKPAGNVVATAPDKTEDEPVKEPVKVETPSGKYDPAKVIAVAMEEVGYLEKETNSQLDSDTANAGDANYTKFARDLDNLGFYNGRKNGYAWCDVFVDWCFVTAYGMAAALALTFQPTKASSNCGAGCKYSRQYYQNNGRLFDTPQPGDQIFFYSSDKTTISHTGLVYAVDKTYVYTVEGNTSSASGVVANGGAVNKKKYRLNYDRLAGYGRPAYDVEYKADSTPVTKYTLGSRTLKVTSPYMKGDDVTELQTRLNALGFDCGTVDGEYGKNTEQGVREFQTAAKIEVDGKFGAESFAALNAYKGSEDTATGSYITYEVKEKDTLWGIAQRFLGNGADWTKIAKLNGISGTIIHAGQQLKIPE